MGITLKVVAKIVSSIFMIVICFFFFLNLSTSPSLYLYLLPSFSTNLNFFQDYNKKLNNLFLTGVLHD